MSIEFTIERDGREIPIIVADRDALLLPHRIKKINEDFYLEQQAVIEEMARALNEMGGDGTALNEQFGAGTKEEPRKPDPVGAMDWLVSNGWYITTIKHLGSNRWTTLAHGNNGVAVQSFQKHPARGWVVATTNCSQGEQR